MSADPMITPPTTSTQRATVQTGFVGVGDQGGPIASRMLAGGFPLAVWARRPEALEPFLAAGASAATGLADLAARCDHIGVCVVTDGDVREVAEALIPAMRPGSLLAVHSTIRPETCGALAERCAAAGLGFLDAPVSGGRHVAAAGELTVMCGGSEADFAKARPVLNTFGKLVVLLGEAGAGQRAKLVNSALLSAHLGIARAAFAASGDLGLDREAFATLVAHSSGRSYGFDLYARLPGPAAFGEGGALLVKDMAMLCAATGEGEPLRRAAERFLAEATEGLEVRT